MLDTLLQDEFIKLTIALGSGIGAFIAVLLGLKSKDRRNPNNEDALHQILKKLQLMHEDISRMKNDFPSVNERVSKLDGRVIDLAQAIAVMMSTEGMTLEKVDNIETAVEILLAVDRRK